MNDYSLPDSLIVTGAGHGIGKAIALSLGQPGREILCISKTDSCLSTQKEIISHGGKASALKLDLADYNFAHKEVLKWVQSKDVTRVGVIAAAAILGPPGPLKDNSLSDWENTFKVNLLGNLAVVQAVLPVMEKEKYGRIIMFSGGGSAYGYPDFPAYSISKTAIVREVENLAQDLSSKGDIAVTCIAPGAIETDLLAAVKAAGGTVHTPGNMADVILCIQALLGNNAGLLSGRFVHARDNWQIVLNKKGANLMPDQWKLRRIEEKIEDK